MKTYKIPVVFQMYGHVEMEADSIDDAVKKVENGHGDVPLPVDADYVEGSFEVDYEGVYSCCNRSQWSCYTLKEGLK